MYFLRFLHKAVCCDDHEHCCPTGTTCDTTSLSCLSTSGSTPMKKKIPATTTVGATATRSQVTGTNEVWKLTGEEEDDLRKTDDERETEGVHCDAHTSCPDHTTCCFMDSTKMWGCCPLPEVSTAPSRPQSHTKYCIPNSKRVGA